jgi:hypothetical protein
MKFLPKNLTSLNLSYLGVTNKGLEFLTHLTTLTSLNLWKCGGITDEGLESLKELKNVAFLDLRNTQVSQEVVERLREELPSCQILYEHESLLFL